MSTTGVGQTARLLAGLAPRLNKAVRRQVQPAAGLSMPQFIALRSLRHGPLSAGALAQRFGVSRPSVTRMVDGLVKRELVERNVDHADRRLAIVSLTERGRALQAATEAAAELYFAGLLAELSADRLGRLHDSLADLAELLDTADSTPAHLTPVLPSDNTDLTTRPDHAPGPRVPGDMH